MEVLTEGWYDFNCRWLGREVSEGVAKERRPAFLPSCTLLSFESKLWLKNCRGDCVIVDRCCYWTAVCFLLKENRGNFESVTTPRPGLNERDWLHTPLKTVVSMKRVEYWLFGR